MNTCDQPLYPFCIIYNVLVIGVNMLKPFLLTTDPLTAVHPCSEHAVMAQGLRQTQHTSFCFVITQVSKQLKVCKKKKLKTHSTRVKAQATFSMVSASQCEISSIKRKICSASLRISWTPKERETACHLEKELFFFSFFFNLDHHHRISESAEFCCRPQGNFRAARFGCPRSCSHIRSANL